jgi:hypothetical protein
MTSGRSPTVFPMTVTGKIQKLIMRERMIEALTQEKAETA